MACVSSCRASRPRSLTAASVAHDPLASSDLIAERRFAYGKAAANDGDWSAAADLYEQTLEQAPDWAAAWFALAEAREKLGDLDAAAQAFAERSRPIPPTRKARRPSRAHWARDAPDTLPPAYVARLFDDYAPRFDEHLSKISAIAPLPSSPTALSGVAPGRRFASALDLGCGTGLMGEALRDRADRLTGVDLSAA